MKRKPENKRVNFEKEDLSHRKLWILFACVFLTLFAILGILKWAHGSQLQDVQRDDVSSKFTYGSEWQSQIKKTRLKYWETERKRLNNRGSVSGSKDIRYIPIREAIEIVSREGIPVWKPVTIPQNNPYPISHENTESNF